MIFTATHKTLFVKNENKKHIKIMTFGKTLHLAEPVSPRGGQAGVGVSPAHFARGPLVVGGSGWPSDQAHRTGDPQGEQPPPCSVPFTL